jgi:hypothetical protein
VGLTYSGGYRNDGYLRSSNLQNIESARIPGEQNRPIVRPEIMNSVEVAATVNITPDLKFDVVGFYNSVNGVLDVGVIYRDRVNPANPQPGQFNVVPVGNDVPGDWNGYWFFKNALGSINQIGGEATLSYNSQFINVSLSHALVKIASVTAEQEKDARDGNSMYLTFDKASNAIRHKVYPENVTRLNVLVTPVKGLDIVVNGMLYSDWLAPDGSTGKGTILLNGGTSFDLTQNIELSVNVSNWLNGAGGSAQSQLERTPLYPMNANAGGPGLQPGAPALENTSFWGRLKVRF